MSRTTVLLLGVFGWWSTPAAAGAAPEDRQPVTMANWELAAQWTPDAVADRLYSLGVEPNWLEDGDRFWYRFETAAGWRYWLVDPERAEKVPLFDHAALAAAIGAISGEPVDADRLELGGLEVVECGQALRFSMRRSGTVGLSASRQTLWKLAGSLSSAARTWSDWPSATCTVSVVK